MATSTIQTITPTTFQTQTVFPLGIQPYSVGVGDFNHDGNADLVAANIGYNNISVLLGDGKGGFAAQTAFPVGALPHAVSIGDFNHDGNADLVVANTGSNNISVLLGDDHGSFGAQTAFLVGYLPIATSIGDFNGDGNLDLAIANWTGNNVSVLLGDGKGGFGTQTLFPVGTEPHSIVVGDFNGDGKPDIATANTGSNNISILLGDGKGGFSPQTTFVVGTKPASVSIGDFNGDGKTDLVTANVDSNNVSILLGNGLGSFAPQTTFAVDPNTIGTLGAQPTSVNVADFNGDGNADLITANWDTNNVSVLLGDGHGNFGSQTVYPVGTTSYAVSSGDFDNDGKIDLVAANWASSNVSVLLNTTVIPNSPPTGAVIINGTPQQNQTLTVSNTLADANGLGIINYQWLKEGQAISGATKTTYSLTADDVGKVISVKASYTDLQKFAESVTSAATIPVIPALSTKPTIGNDLLTGTAKNDVLSGLEGNDTLIGGLGADTLTGGLGADVFKFTSTNDTGITAKTRDVITDFKTNEGDKIDLSAMDANTKLAGHQSFTFIGNKPFSSSDASAQLRFDSVTHILYGSTNADSTPEFSIQLNGVTSLTQTDFIL